jgi:beta-N-acetylhexosaminidase
MDEMIEIVGRIGDATPDCVARLERAMATVAGGTEPGDFDALVAKRDALLALV